MSPVTLAPLILKREGVMRHGSLALPTNTIRNTFIEDIAVIERKRELTSHKVNGLNEALDIAVLDEPGPGNACHRYVIYAPHDEFSQELNASVACHINFQNGPIKEAGVNGISNESLLAVVEDRLAGFQAGDYATSDNAEALSAVQHAIECLHRRTKERVSRGVEGTMAK